MSDATAFMQPAIVRYVASLPAWVEALTCARAINLFNVKPNRVDATGPYGVNGGYYYLRARVKL